MQAAADRFWPFPSRASAFVVTPLLFVLLLVVWWQARSTLPLDRADPGWMLVGITVVSLVPVILVVLDGLSRAGGTIEVASVKVSLVAAAAVAPTIDVPRNVSQMPGTALADSGNHQILEALNQAAGSNVVVVDLESGKAWWETRLLVLAAGAARRSRPRVVVFVARLGEDDRQFVGWARPAAIRDVLLASDLRYQQAMDQARATAAALLLRRAEGATVQVTLASPVGVIAALSSNAALSPFLEEQLLAAELGKHEADDPRELSASGLRNLLGPALRTGSVETSDSSAAWFRAALMQEDDVALTNRGRYVAIMARTALVTEVLLALTHSASAS